jgi:dihydroneopterin aldolase
MAPDGRLKLAALVEAPETTLDAGRRARTVAEDGYTVRVRGLVVDFSIGIHAHEKQAPQRIRVDVTVDCDRPDEGFAEDYTRVYCYERLCAAIRDLAGGGHIKLVETLADRIAELALSDDRARRSEVTVEKLDVFDDAQAVGVTTSRRRL